MSHHHYFLQKKAADFRMTCGLSNVEAVRLKSLLLKLRVISIFTPLSENISGIAIKAENDRFMMINANHSLGRQHFTICHELYHLFIQDNFNGKVCKTGVFPSRVKDQEEYNADNFAAFFLLPEDGIISLIPDNELKKDHISLPTILKIEQYFSCSRIALLYRLKNLSLITRPVLEGFKDRITHQASEYGFDTTLYRKGNTGHIIGDYMQLAKELFDDEKISEAHFLTLTNDFKLLTK